jgi:poly(A) polymerase
MRSEESTQIEPHSLSELLAGGSPVLQLAERFRAASHELYLVGGPVRDAALGRRHVDLDFATDARPDETLDIIKPLAQDVWMQGVQYGTVGARISGLPMEITTFRTESYVPGSRNPKVEFESDIETDLSRRDFTINAMAVRLPDKLPIDPFEGMADLKARRIRTPIDPAISFTDDPLRMLRAFRFASQLEFRIDKTVLDSVNQHKDEIATVSAERIRDELSKLVTGPAPGHALELAGGTGLIELILPELPALKLEQDPVHRHKDVFAHTLAVLERARPAEDLELRLAAMLHDIGKPRTRRIGPSGVSFHHHEIVGADMAKERLRSLRYSNNTTETVEQLIRLHHRFHTYKQGWTDAAVRRYARDAGPLLHRLNALVRADCTTRNPALAISLARRMDELEARIKELAAREELDRLRPELDGVQIMAYLGVGEGRLVGEARDFLMEIRLEEGRVGEEEAYRRLHDWGVKRGIQVAGRRVPPKERKRPQT